MRQAALFIIALVALTRASASECLGEDKDHIVLSRQHVNMGQDYLYAGVIRQMIGKFEGTSANNHRMYYVGGVDVNIFRVNYDEYPCGKPFLAYEITNANTARIDTFHFPWLTGIDIASESLGGSGDGFAHEIFGLIDGKLIDVTPTGGLNHTNMGGFYIGPLGKGLGVGIAVWDADWTDGAHYDPHPYVVQYYTWNGTKFVPTRKIASKESYDPSGSTPAFIEVPAGRDFNSRGDSFPFAELRIERDQP